MDFLRSEANIKTTDKRTDTTAWTLLHFAAGSGQFELIRILIEDGADKEAVNNHGRTPLNNLAAKSDRYALIKTLLDKCAKIETADTLKRTPLTTAAGFGHFEAVRIQLNDSANKETADFHG